MRNYSSSLVCTRAIFALLYIYETRQKACISNWHRWIVDRKFFSKYSNKFKSSISLIVLCSEVARLWPMPWFSGNVNDTPFKSESAAFCRTRKLTQKSSYVNYIKFVVFFDRVTVSTTEPKSWFCFSTDPLYKTTDRMQKWYFVCTVLLSFSSLCWYYFFKLTYRVK